MWRSPWPPQRTRAQIDWRRLSDSISCACWTAVAGASTAATTRRLCSASARARSARACRSSTSGGRHVHINRIGDQNGASVSDAVEAELDRAPEVAKSERSRARELNPRPTDYEQESG